MTKTTLVILAAGIGSRYGKGIKQLAPVGPNGEIIMDYSVYDALEAGFHNIVFIIRRDLEQEFRQIAGDRISKIAPVSYAYQSLDTLPEGFAAPCGRTKPWGTGQAILCCRSMLDTPFAVINADDFYGKEGFRKIHDFLSNSSGDDTIPHYCMAGFILGNTLSDNGSVTRGICTVNENGHLTSVKETREIIRTADGIQAPDEAGGFLRLSKDSLVSMNLWGFTPRIFPHIEEAFRDFLSSDEAKNPKSEFLLPTVVDRMIQNGTADVTVLETKDRWFGVTYVQDRAFVASSIQQLVKEGIYPEKLF